MVKGKRYYENWRAGEVCIKYRKSCVEEQCNGRGKTYCSGYQPPRKINSSKNKGLAKKLL